MEVSKKTKRLNLLNSKDVARLLSISPRTFRRRMAENGWTEGYGFFKSNGKWYIREEDLDKIIQLMEEGWIQKRYQHRNNVLERTF